MIHYIQDLVALSPRMWEGEEKTYQYLKTVLQKHNILFEDQAFELTIPRWTEASLKLDGKPIPALGTGLRSGKITDNHRLISSLVFSDYDQYMDGNINFNPANPDSVARVTMYEGPALAIASKDVPQVLAAKKVEGIMQVEQYAYTSHNLLVGNLSNPKHIIFNHYDCWETGALDNASGVAVCLDTLIKHPELLADSLFVFAGNEEISFEMPIYWGAGYRRFEETYQKLLNDAVNIFLVDGVGNSEPVIITDPFYIREGIPLQHLDGYISKIEFISGDYQEMLPYYHSASDTTDKIKLIYLQKAQEYLIQALLK